MAATTARWPQARDRAADLRGRLTDCPAMVEVAEELDAPSSGELGWLRVGDLPPDLGKAVLGPRGRRGQPAAAGAGRHPPADGLRAARPAGLTPEREQIAQRLEQERTERLARRHLRDLRKQAFVEVRL